MDNEGLEFLADSLPAPFDGIIRGVVIRSILFVRSLKSVIFRVLYPLPIVIAFSPLPENDNSLFRHPVYCSSPSGDGFWGQTVAKSVSLSRAASRGSRKLLARLRSQPTVAYFQIDANADEQSQLPLFEEGFIRELAHRKLWRSGESSKKAMVIRSLCTCAVNQNLRRRNYTTSRGTLVLVVSNECCGKWEGLAAPEAVPFSPAFVDSPLADDISRAALLASPRARPPVVFCPANSRNAKWFFGLGDVLLGAALTHQTARSLGRLTVIDWSRYSGGSLFAPTGEEVYIPKMRKAEHVSQQINSDVPLDIAVSRFVFTNRRPVTPLEPETRAFLFASGVCQNGHARAAAKEFLTLAGLEPRGYAAVHVRFGDEKDQKSGVTELILQKLKVFCSETSPVLMMSDKPLLLLEAGLNSIATVRNHGGSHSGLDTDEESLMFALTDLELLGQSDRIFSYSRYAWGSGFAQIASELHQVPLVKRTAFRKVFE